MIQWRYEPWPHVHSAGNWILVKDFERSFPTTRIASSYFSKWVHFQIVVLLECSVSHLQFTPAEHFKTMCLMTWPPFVFLWGPPCQLMDIRSWLSRVIVCSALSSCAFITLILPSMIVFQLAMQHVYQTIYMVLTSCQPTRLQSGLSSMAPPEERTIWAKVRLVIVHITLFARKTLSRIPFLLALRSGDPELGYLVEFYAQNWERKSWELLLRRHILSDNSDGCTVIVVSITVHTMFAALEDMWAAFIVSSITAFVFNVIVMLEDFI